MISCLRATPTACLYLFSFGKKNKNPSKGPSNNFGEKNPHNLPRHLHEIDCEGQGDRFRAERKIASPLDCPIEL
jgi:hypothetical protein